MKSIETAVAGVVRHLFFLLVGVAGCLLAAAAEAGAASLDIVVRGSDGRVLEDAVVSVHPAGLPPQKGFTLPWPAEVRQQDVSFSPHVLIVPVGAQVRFPNLDKVRHHVYSLSKGNRFEIRLYGKDETRSHTFTSVGVAALGCNIHDRMAAYVVVVDTPFATLTDRQGRARIEGAPAAAAGEVRVWHEDLRNPGRPVAFSVARLGAGRPLDFTIPTASMPAHTH